MAMESTATATTTTRSRGFLDCPKARTSCKILWRSAPHGALERARIRLLHAREEHLESFAPPRQASLYSRVRWQWRFVLRSLDLFLSVAHTKAAAALKRFWRGWPSREPTCSATTVADNLPKPLWLAEPEEALWPCMEARGQRARRWQDRHDYPRGEAAGGRGDRHRQRRRAGPHPLRSRLSHQSRRRRFRPPPRDRRRARPAYARAHRNDSVAAGSQAGPYRMKAVPFYHAVRGRRFRPIVVRSPLGFGFVGAMMPNKVHGQFASIRTGEAEKESQDAAQPHHPAAPKTKPMIANVDCMMYPRLYARASIEPKAIGHLILAARAVRRN